MWRHSNWTQNKWLSYIKINRLKWAGHVIRMEEQIPTRRVLVAVVEGRRQRGRPKLRWEDGVTEDARKLGERNWRNAARNRDSWQKLLKKALAQTGLLCQWWWWWWWWWQVIMFTPLIGPGTKFVDFESYVHAIDTFHCRNFAFLQ